MPTVSSGDSILFVGDIQGCLDPLERLLRISGYDPDRHRLIPVGDTINRGPQNTGVLSLLHGLGAEPILGNHEAKLLASLEGKVHRGWMDRQSLARDLLPSPELERWIAYIQSWPLWREGEDWLAVHAGLHPLLPLDQTLPRFLLSVRVCDPEGHQPPGWDGLNETIPPGYQPWHDYYTGDRTIVYGHWARQGLHVTHNTRGLDSGCVYGGKLTGWWYPEDRLIQVPC